MRCEGIRRGVLDPHAGRASLDPLKMPKAHICPQKSTTARRLSTIRLIQALMFPRGGKRISRLPPSRAARVRHSARSDQSLHCPDQSFSPDCSAARPRPDPKSDSGPGAAAYNHPGRAAGWHEFNTGPHGCRPVKARRAVLAVACAAAVAAIALAYSGYAGTDRQEPAELAEPAAEKEEATRQEQSASDSSANQGIMWAKVTRVVDGDTVYLDGESH